MTDDRSERLEQWRKELRALQLEQKFEWMTYGDFDSKVRRLQRELNFATLAADEAKKSALEVQRRIDDLLEVGRKNGFSQ
jgi:thermostable 8-oxoguanine DNA glycosylase